jgi:ribosome-associated protein
MDQQNPSSDHPSHFEIKDEFIHLSQLMKALGWVESGAVAGMEITDGLVKVNGEIELRKRNKIYKNFIVEYNGEKILVK